MEEPVDTEATPHSVVHRATVTGHHGVRDGHVQVVGAARRVQHRHQIPVVYHTGTTVNNGLQTQVSRAGFFYLFFFPRTVHFWWDM